MRMHRSRRMALAFHSTASSSLPFGPLSLAAAASLTPMSAGLPPPSGRMPLTLGELASSSGRSPLGSPPPPGCPCCSFLPWGGGPFGGSGICASVNGGEGEARNASGEEPSLALDGVASLSEAWARISAAGNPREGGTDGAPSGQRTLLVDTHGHPHLRRGVQYRYDEAEGPASPPTDDDDRVVSLTCGVSPADWSDCLEHASASPRRLPALGVHPWYLGDIMKDPEEVGEGAIDDVERLLDWAWLEELEARLSEHPRLVVGEIGLCKMARFVREFPKDEGGKAAALRMQKLVFRRQLDLAARWSRPVTVHCVNAHGLFMETLREVLDEARASCAAEANAGTPSKEAVRRAFPPAIAMHSFTGTAHHVGEILDFETQILRPEEAARAGGRGREKKRRDRREGGSGLGGGPGPSACGDRKEGDDVLFYFGFSHAVNHVMCTSEKARRKGTEAARAVPPDRLLVESDVHHPADVVLGTAGAVAYATRARGERLEDLAERSTRNGLRFLSALGSFSRGRLDGGADRRGGSSNDTECGDATIPEAASAAG